MTITSWPLFASHLGLQCGCSEVKRVQQQRWTVLLATFFVIAFVCAVVFALIAIYIRSWQLDVPSGWWPAYEWSEEILAVPTCQR